jgi:hypothetical protein
MTKLQSFLNHLKKPHFILALILIVFFLKGVFLATARPIFDGQDEARHYTTIQYLNEPKEKIWEMEKELIKKDRDDFETYGFSEEIRKTATAANVNILRTNSFNTIDFSKEYKGKNEDIINSMIWKPYNYSVSPEIVGGGKAYHKLTFFIEKSLQDHNILIRFFSNRIFSVFLGVFAVFLAYLIAKNIGFSKKHSLLITAIIAFQPKFSDYSTNINYDTLLIPMFFLFTLGGVLALRKGLDWKNILIMTAGATIAYLTKDTGLILFVALAFLVFYFVYKKTKEIYPRFIRYFYGLSAIATIFFLFFFKKYLPLVGGLASTFSSLSEYLDKSLTMGRFALSSRTYWGSLGWVDSWVLSNFTDIIWLFQFFALLGLIFYFFSQKIPAWLPEKKYVIFLIGMIVALQLGIRLADWNVFVNLGRIELGAPGRYFLPNLASHVILVFIGLGMFFEKISLRFKSISSEKFLDHSLKLGLILMFSLSMYLIFDVIIYRFYL